MVNCITKLSGVTCTYHPAVVGSNPKHINYASSVKSQILYFICHFVEKRTKTNKKRPSLAHFSPV